jgi:hypothetical protein
LEEFLLPDGEQEPEEGFRFCQGTDGWTLAEASYAQAVEFNPDFKEAKQALKKPK